MKIKDKRKHAARRRSHNTRPTLTSSSTSKMQCCPIMDREIPESVRQLAFWQGKPPRRQAVTRHFVS